METDDRHGVTLPRSGSAAAAALLRRNSRRFIGRSSVITHPSYSGFRSEEQRPSASNQSIRSFMSPRAKSLLATWQQSCTLWSGEATTVGPLALILLIFASISYSRKKQLDSLVAADFPTVAPDRFDEWRLLELKSVDIFLWVAAVLFLISIVLSLAM